ncbi:MAG: DUF1540 domain-containing protein [Peptococcaceae bacterium]|nr:DUF1540 domain-containing protein [Peptococcaceae bacterium]
MTTPDLKCTVDSCHFWRNGDHCHASEVEVNTQADKAHSSADTVCTTFKPE